MQGYIPVACILHERLEFAVLRRLPLAMRWQTEDGASRGGTVLPIDVATRDGAEWLTVRHAGGDAEVIRLDRLLSVEEVPARGDAALTGRPAAR